MKPYSDDYNTVLKQAQNDQHKQARPALKKNTGKRILPFCSHGGGRFGQSITAIAKLAPNAKIGEGLSVHYSGGSSLSKDVAKWLEKNGVKTK